MTEPLFTDEEIAETLKTTTIFREHVEIRRPGHERTKVTAFDPRSPIDVVYLKLGWKWYRYRHHHLELFSPHTEWELVQPIKKGNAHAQH